MSSDAPNRMIQSVCRSVEGIKRLNDDMESVFEEFGMTETQKEAFRECRPFRMVESGAHPLLTMHFMFATNPQMSAMMSILEYPELFEDD
jgi:hypothetical protein